ncbi:MAG: hypothetical protein ABEK50_05500 [bacterium]
MNEFFTGTPYIIFLIFAAVGIAEIVIFLVALYRYSSRKERLNRLKKHLEDGYAEDEVTEEFYDRYRKILREF